MGANAHGKIGEYTSQLEKGTAFVEIGCGDASTPILIDICKKAELIFYSIDINNTRVSEDYNIIYEYGEQFLKDFHKWTYPKKYEISAAYLDNFDWFYNPVLYYEKQLDEDDHARFLEYQKEGLVLSNINSQITHLTQTILVEELSADKCVILYDDTYYVSDQDTYSGKGGPSIIYLLSKGWEILPFTHTDLKYPEFAVMMGKNIIPNQHQIKKF